MAIELDKRYIPAWINKAKIKRIPLWLFLGSILLIASIPFLFPFPFSLLTILSVILFVMWLYSKNERKILRKIKKLRSENIQNSEDLSKELSHMPLYRIARITEYLDLRLLSIIFAIIITISIYICDRILFFYIAKSELHSISYYRWCFIR